MIAVEAELLQHREVRHDGVEDAVENQSISGELRRKGRKEEDELVVL